ncbi:MAG: hypothetical protein ACJA09_003704 [Alcanivorax sp.]|jgi:hypothetical protein
MTVCSHSDDQKVVPVTPYEGKKESGFDLENNQSEGFNFFCSLKKAGASKSRICAVMQIDEERFRRFVESAGIGKYYCRSY